MGKSTTQDSLRIFLVVVDDSEEMRAALRYACRRAQKTGGRVALLWVVQSSELQQYALLGQNMASEIRSQAEERLQSLAKEVTHISGHDPLLFIREGETQEELLKLLEEEPRISILVLAANDTVEDLGPLVSGVTGSLQETLRIPTTIVPGSLTDQEIDVMT